jgi:subtilisin family serine protease
MSKQTARVQVLVVDIDRQPLPDADVALLPAGRAAGRGGGVVALRFHQERGRYLVADVEPGEYELRVEAKGLEPETRTLRVDTGTVDETFILGPTGGRALYRGRVRVPFDPPKGLWAVSVRPPAPGEKDLALNPLAKSLGFEVWPVGESILRDNVVVFQEPAGVDERTVLDRKRQIAASPRVEAVGPVVRLDEQSVAFLTGEIILKLEPSVTLREVRGLEKRFDLKILRKIPYAGNAFLMRSKKGGFGVLDECKALLETGLVEYAEPHLAATAVEQVVVNDALFGSEWNAAKINLRNAWQVLQNHNPVGTPVGGPGDRTFGREEIVIAVMDTGVISITASGTTSAQHPDFQGNVTSGQAKMAAFFDFTYMVANNDDSGNTHGTKCAGVVGARVNNPPGGTEGVVGAAPNCRLMGLRRPGGPELNYADAYIWAAGFDPHSTRSGFPPPLGFGADVITNSFAFSAGFPISGLMSDVFDFLTTYGRDGRGVVLCFPTGEESDQVARDFTLYSPWAAHDKTLAVGASNVDDRHSSYSNYGALVDVCAPSNDSTNVGGVTTLTGGIVTTTIDAAGSPGYVTDFGGTSAATPLVAGVAALLLSANPALTWVEVRQILRDTAEKIDLTNTDSIGRWVDTDGDGQPDHSQWYGYGRIAAGAAVQAAVDLDVLARDMVVRDVIGDTGAVPSPGPTFWESPDLWVRQRDPASDGAAALPATYGDPPPHQNPKSGQDNYVYVRLKNVGSRRSHDFYIRVYVAHYAGTEFVYPDNFIPTSRPGAAPLPPVVPGTYLIGRVHVSSLDRGAVDTWHVRWPAALVPPETVMLNGSSVHWHPCLLVEVSPHDGPAATGVHVWDRNNLAQRNVTVLYPPAGSSFSMAAITGNAGNGSRFLEIVVDRRDVPPGIEMHVDLGDRGAMRRLEAWLGAYRKASRSGAKRGRVPFPVEGIPKGYAHPARAHADAWGKLRTGVLNGRRVVWLDPQGSTRIPIFSPGSRLTPITVGGWVPKDTKPGTSRIRLIQLDEHGQTTGGVSAEVVIR